MGPRLQGPPMPPPHVWSGLEGMGRVSGGLYTCSLDPKHGLPALVKSPFHTPNLARTHGTGEPEGSAWHRGLSTGWRGPVTLLTIYDRYLTPLPQDRRGAP